MARLWQGEQSVRHFQWQHSDESRPFQETTERHNGRRLLQPLLPVLPAHSAGAAFCTHQFCNFCSFAKETSGSACRTAFRLLPTQAFLQLFQFHAEPKFGVLQNQQKSQISAKQFCHPVLQAELCS